MKTEKDPRNGAPRPLTEHWEKTRKSLGSVGREGLNNGRKEVDKDVGVKESVNPSNSTQPVTTTL